MFSLIRIHCCTIVTQPYPVQRLVAIQPLFYWILDLIFNCATRPTAAWFFHFHFFFIFFFYFDQALNSFQALHGLASSRYFTYSSQIRPSSRSTRPQSSLEYPYRPSHILPTSHFTLGNYWSLFFPPATNFLHDSIHDPGVYLPPTPTSYLFFPPSSFPPTTQQ